MSTQRFITNRRIKGDAPAFWNGIQPLLATLIFLVALHKHPKGFVSACASSTRLCPELDLVVALAVLG